MCDVKLKEIAKFFYLICFYILRVTSIENIKGKFRIN